MVGAVVGLGTECLSGLSRVWIGLVLGTIWAWRWGCFGGCGEEGLVSVRGGVLRVGVRRWDCLGGCAEEGLWGSRRWCFVDG